MAPPPGLSGMALFHPPIILDKTKKLKISNPGPKFLVMERVNEVSADNTNTLKNVSPFLIKKVIDSTCCGTVEFCKKLRNGTVLIKTKNLSQATALIQLCSLSESIKVTVVEHASLNYVKGVIYSNDLRGMPNEEILHELKDQNVSEVRKILRKVNDELVETGLIILTFAALELPGEVFIGYERVQMRPYIPLPLRCNNCFLYGHIAKTCVNKKICGLCSNEYHLNAEMKEQCTNPKSCINCKCQDHASIDKSCPIFIKEKEIQTIMTLEKVNKKTAIITYNNRHQINSSSFANTVKNIRTTKPKLDNTTSSANIQLNADAVLPNSSSRSVINYSDVDPISSKPTSISKPSSKTVIIPTRTSKRLKRQIKKHGLPGSSSKISDNLSKIHPSICPPEDDTSDSFDMDTSVVNP